VVTTTTTTTTATTTTTTTVGRLVAGLVLLFGNGYLVTIEFAPTRVRQFAESECQGSRGLVTATDAFEAIAGGLEDPLDEAGARGG
jgi:CBS domain containing-hemolysin-like protein